MNRVSLLVVRGLRPAVDWLCRSIARARPRVRAAEPIGSGREEAFYHAVLQAAPDAVLTVDEKGTIALVNSQVEALFGYSRDELIGQSVELLLPESLRAAHVAHRGHYKAEPRRRLMGSRLLSGRRRDGTEIPVEIGLSPLATERGHLVIAVVRDIRERLKAQQEHARLIEEEQARKNAEEANRLKDRFLATLSHELRTPLNAVLGWARLLQTGRLDPASTSQAVDIIARNAGAQAKLIEDLLDVSRIAAAKLQLECRDVDLASAVREALDSVRVAASAKDIRTDVDLGGERSTVWADPDRLGQVLSNLLGNAVKFTPPGGRITVTLDRGDGEAVVRVKDTGIGISPEFLPLVFDRFSQADDSGARTHRGLGLGLTIARQLVELHGGTVQASSAGEGQGATFAVTLPLGADRPEHASRRTLTHPPAIRAEAATVPPSSDLAGINVLAVDDESDALELVAAVLREHGANVTTAASGREALDVFRRSRPDVLLSDLAMPGENGYWLLRQVQATDRGPAVPVVALTAYARAEDRNRALAAGFTAYLPKPIEPAALVGCLRTVARPDGSWHGEN